MITVLTPFDKKKKQKNEQKFISKNEKIMKNPNLIKYGVTIVAFVVMITSN